MKWDLRGFFFKLKGKNIDHNNMQTWTQEQKDLYLLEASLIFQQLQVLMEF